MTESGKRTSWCNHRDAPCAGKSIYILHHYISIAASVVCAEEVAVRGTKAHFTKTWHKNLPVIGEMQIRDPVKCVWSGGRIKNPSSSSASNL